eukprot:3675448-Prymnesium_polylepis.1
MSASGPSGRGKHHHMPPRLGELCSLYGLPRTSRANPPDAPIPGAAAYGAATRCPPVPRACAGRISEICDSRTTPGCALPPTCRLAIPSTSAPTGPPRCSICAARRGDRAPRQMRRARPMAGARLAMCARPACARVRDVRSAGVRACARCALGRRARVCAPPSSGAPCRHGLCGPTVRRSGAQRAAAPPERRAARSPPRWRPWPPAHPLDVPSAPPCWRPRARPLPCPSRCRSTGPPVRGERAGGEARAKRARAVAFVKDRWNPRGPGRERKWRSRWRDTQVCAA